ncbi:energy-coupling factor ABC transporter ATP-binding protein [Cellulomonas sp. P24]|uniref:energy-coupling factor ABC transporter ATP-binding protein n=1 Tax=Cellulomonas sp. P24 TaxID=2885206 RepID=UPI00216B5423|nr:ABC transporter ATP-binding protein [Cellulomonas sp. P24]MCR6491192.1 energy-coupling factor ABC transporter ATP-binding protein [Cellulomonas sp. P24]
MIRFDAATVTAPGPRPGADPIQLLAPLTCTLSERRIAVIGANGSGKSTLARLVNGLVLPAAGHVTVDGWDTARHGGEVRRRVGFVFTDPDAQLVMPTPLEDVTLSLRRLDLSRAERASRARAVLESFGLGDRADVAVHSLSGGQKQLLALACVLATDPVVLVCDEPTTLLDLRWRRHVETVLDGLTQQVLLVTHDLASAARADRVLVVDGGHVVHDGDASAGVAYYESLMTAGSSTDSTRGTGSP